MASNIIKFRMGLQSAFDSVKEKDVNTFYFTSDTQRFFVGETEYSRPVQFGGSLPSGYNPPNSFFVVEHESGERELHYSQDGKVWINVAVLPKEVTGGVFGTNANTELTFGGELTVPKITVNKYGAVTSAQDQKMTLPKLVASVQNETLTLG